MPHLVVGGHIWSLEGSESVIIMETFQTNLEEVISVMKE